MTKLLSVLSALIVAMIAVTFWSNKSPEAQPVTTSSAPATQQKSAPPQGQPHIHQFAAKGRVPAYYETAPDLRALRPTLSPELFNGNQRLAYQVAKEIPQVLAQLPCYCHCDRGQGHKSLHSCFESEHGENCGICIGEALMAHNLDSQGVSASEIRRQIIAAYGQR